MERYDGAGRPISRTALLKIAAGGMIPFNQEKGIASPWPESSSFSSHSLLPPWPSIS
jgi:hypothetical protein